jgi:hypothetical protein
VLVVSLVDTVASASAASGLRIVAFEREPIGVVNDAIEDKAEQPALTIDKLTQDLQKAGFSEVKILQDAFLVQAKTKDGNSILMTIGPNVVPILKSVPGIRAFAVPS